MAIHLIPTQSDYNYLHSIIKDLSLKYDSPLFMPHITLYAAKIPLKFRKKINEFIRPLAKMLEPISLKSAGLLYTDTYFKSLYLQLKTSPILTVIYKNVRSYLGKYDIYNFDPHLSLIYKIMDISEKQKIIKKLSLPKEFIFDRLAIVEPGGKNKEEWGDINKLKVTLI